jgi:hypothetical protein
MNALTTVVAVIAIAAAAISGLALAWYVNTSRTSRIILATIFIAMAALGLVRAALQVRSHVSEALLSLGLAAYFAALAYAKVRGPASW